MALSDDDIKKSRQEALKNAGLKDKIAYFWEYYKIHLMVVVFCAIFFGALIHDTITNKDYGFYAIMVNCYQTVEEEDVESEFGTLADIDTDKYQVLIDLTTSLNLNTFDQYTIANSEKIMAITASGDLDVITADADTFNYFARSSMFYDLRDIMSEEELSKYEGYIYYIDQAVIDAVNDGTYESEYASTSDTTSDSAADSMSTIMESGDELTLSTYTESEYISPEDFVAPDPSEMENPIPVGIICTEAPYITEMCLYQNRVPVVGVVASSKRIDLGIEFIDYLWEGSDN